MVKSSRRQRRKPDIKQCFFRGPSHYREQRGAEQTQSGVIFPPELHQPQLQLLGPDQIVVENENCLARRMMSCTSEGGDIIKPRVVFKQ